MDSPFALTMSSDTHGELEGTPELTDRPSQRGQPSVLHNQLSKTTTCSQVVRDGGAIPSFSWADVGTLIGS